MILVTSSGKQIEIPPRPEQVDIRDIAKGLSNTCLFAGQGRYYSAAERAVIVSRMVEKGHALWGLLHNASEAYLGAGVVRVGPLIEIERGIMDSVVKRFDLDPEMHMPMGVRVAVSDLLPEEYVVVLGGEKSSRIRCLPPALAERRFLTRYDQING